MVQRGETERKNIGQEHFTQAGGEGKPNKRVLEGLSGSRPQRDAGASCLDSVGSHVARVGLECGGKDEARNQQGLTVPSVAVDQGRRRPGVQPGDADGDVWRGLRVEEAVCWG